MSPPMSPPMSEECESCGAAKNPGLVACSYCETAYPNAPRGIDCPACGDDNRPHLVRCATCSASLMQSCVFCGGATSIALAGCALCGEAFEGAEARKAAREQHIKQQQMIGLAQSGLSLLGQAASAPSARGILGEVFQDLVKHAVKKP